MPLTNKDLQRIHKLGYDKKTFVRIKGEIPRLRNLEGRCIFLQEEGCMIYRYRPEGCRLYPLVYNVDVGRTVLDPLCPFWCLFKPTEENVEKLLRLIESSERVLLP